MQRTLLAVLLMLCGLFAPGANADSPYALFAKTEARVVRAEGRIVTTVETRAVPASSASYSPSVSSAHGQGSMVTMSSPISRTTTQGSFVMRSSFGGTAGNGASIATASETAAARSKALANGQPMTVPKVQVQQASAKGVLDQPQAAKSGSPTLTHGDLAGKSAPEIRGLATDKRLVPHPTKQDKWMDPVTGKERLRIDPGHVDKKTGLPYNDPKAAAPHHHGYGPDGKTKVVDPTDGNPHIPTRQ